MKTKNNKRVKPAQKQVAYQKPKALTRAEKTKQLVLASILTAMVFVLAWISTFVRIGGTVPITLTLIPVVLGAAICSTKVAVWLGLMSGITALITTFMDPASNALFIQTNIGGTFITIFAKGAFCGLAASVVYNSLKNRNKYLAVLAAGAICPIVNTAIFLLGCFMFFFQRVSIMAGEQNIFLFMIIGFVGINFVVELLVNMVVSPAIVRLLNIRKKA